jgi:tetratricopeptide (TPR) repeat protein
MTRFHPLLVVSLLTGSGLTPVYAADVDKLPLSGLAPARITPDLCLLRYRVSTASPECQAHFDQGLGYFYSYVWMEAARSFETAAQLDPDCGMAWWGLSRALDKWARVNGEEAVARSKELQARDKNGEEALKRAKELMTRVTHREQLLITARLQEKGLMPGVTADARKKSAASTIDDLLVLYDDDEEAWFYRAQLAENGAAAVPYYKALLRINPVHPGANHELVHFYEGGRRPALGWPYAEKYMESSPGLPHAFHMQAHLATRLGRWEKTSDRSTRAIELQRAYHRDMKVKASEDHQWYHHLAVLTVSLIHDGRFREARAIKAEAQADGIQLWQDWFRLHLAERDWDEAEKIIQHFRKSDKAMAGYLAAQLYLKQGNVERALAEVEVLRHEFQTKRNNKQLEFRLWEMQGALLCRQGAADEGLKLLSRAVDRSKDDYSHHSWGNGAYYMELWGQAALRAGKDDVAEEAFLEALAHDHGSVRAAVGMQVLCEKQGRSDEALKFGELAQRCWRKADPQALETLRTEEFNLKNESASR